MEERNPCPECREEFADRTLRVNRALANLAEKARNLNLNPKGKESKRHCEEHEEELKLFCETDKALICMICAVAEEHREHCFRPIKGAVKIYKDHLKSSLDSLTKKKSDFQEKEQQQKEKISEVQKQSHSVQTHITSQFAELRQIITEKEQSLLRDLRTEEERILNPMRKNLRLIQGNIKIIQEEITKLKEQMDQKDSVMFLKEEAHQNRRISDNVQELSVTDEALPVEKFEHLYLLKTVLKETLDAINRVSVTLDVETAHPELAVSEDRKSVTWTGTRRDLPDAGKRFTYWDCVLGSERFTSGRHYWEVEVTGNRRWCLGVAAESVERKRRTLRQNRSRSCLLQSTEAIGKNKGLLTFSTCHWCQYLPTSLVARPPPLECQGPDRSHPCPWHLDTSHHPGDSIASTEPLVVG
ncbi:E3 ubiquitin-protein ligase TRIM39-like isoform X2 [Hypanus sabinus]|uniref:E3 ubiquitin-protein ligase TRIM39-like isoform X2 n=1 Tax=Hypanus sabinus TaxID=79690 RepID=UPI0028C39DB1|nr:E3 ubiquitin-protein ligase TRIM39-like isoform X2 [Hypanus sabinus]